MFKKIDADGDGTISKAEFTKSHEALKARFTSHFHHKKPEAKSDGKPGEKKPEPKKEEGKKSDDKKPEPKKKPKGDDKAEAPTQDPAVTESAPAEAAEPTTEKVSDRAASKLWQFASGMTVRTIGGLRDEARPLELVGLQFSKALQAEPTFVAQLPDSPASE